ncbi:uncharacterized protein LOC106417370 [Brassica napus]|uniref:uncharacterized protein LOC106417370 n=1 Tax=Brassica napus TaxID=3708 RepID=UPI0006AA98E2|nr:uncharacterized protein LOC106417370 [Brassica napus]
MVQTQDEVLITNDLPIAGSKNFCQRGTQKSPLIMSNMIQTQDEISSTHDSPIAGSSNVFERGTKTHVETEWNNIRRVDEVSGIQYTRISDSLISPSSGLVSNKRSVSQRQATAKLLGTMVSNHYEGGKIGLKPNQIMEKARKDHGVVISYSKAWRSQEHGQDIARGTPDDSYEALPSWFHMIKEKNPGSVTFIEVDSVGKFKYAFLSLGPSTRGFKLMRKVLSVDGAHLKAKYKGTLLGATTQDSNFHLYPIAFAIVDSENEASWSWFMKCLKTIIPDEEDLVFVSDRATSIENALLRHYPVAHHGICVFHFKKNAQDNFKSSTLVPLVVEAAYAYTKAYFDCYFHEIEASDIVLADYLRKADFRMWSRSYSPANRFNIMTSNLAESVNSLLKLSRVRHMHLATLEVGNNMKELYDFMSRFLEVSKINDSEFEVKGDTRDQVVNFQTRHCSCFVFDVEKFPCAHAIAAANAGNKHENDYVDEFFSNERFTLAYSETVYPVGDKTYWNISPHVASFVCRPPSTRFPSGRRKKKRGFQVRGSMENIGPYPNHHPILTNVADVNRKDTTKVVV